MWLLKVSVKTSGCQLNFNRKWVVQQDSYCCLHSGGFSAGDVFCQEIFKWHLCGLYRTWSKKYDFGWLCFDTNTTFGLSAQYNRVESNAQVSRRVYEAATVMSVQTCCKCSLGSAWPYALLFRTPYQVSWLCNLSFSACFVNVIIMQKCKKFQTVHKCWFVVTENTVYSSVEYLCIKHRCTNYACWVRWLTTNCHKGAQWAQ